MSLTFCVENIVSKFLITYSDYANDVEFVKNFRILLLSELSPLFGDKGESSTSLTKEKSLVNDSSTITITFGDRAENHVGMEMLGQLAEMGFTNEELRSAEKMFREHGVQVEFYDLLDLLDDKSEGEEASVLVIRNGLSVLSENQSDALALELENLSPDTRYWDRRRKKVLNKIARHNLCFDDVGQEPNYDEGRGRIVSYSDVPITHLVQSKLAEFFGPKAENLVGEANYYYDINKCGIGFHGDSERRKVIAFRVGASMPLHYQWYFESIEVGQRLELNLNHGDVYIMSEKATGFDWKRRKILTLRHAAGAKKYLKQ